jgi:hypothetical protein
MANNLSLGQVHNILGDVRRVIGDALQLARLTFVQRALGDDGRMRLQEILRTDCVDSVKK